MADDDIKTPVAQSVGEEEEIGNQGLKKKILKEGEGLDTPHSGDLVEVHYTGTKLDGTQVWSSRDRGKPLKLTISQGPPGVKRWDKRWDVGLKTMKKGEKALFTIPFVLSDSPKEVTPIQFDVELLSWEKVSRNTTQGKKEEPNANKKRKSKRKAAAWVGKRVPASGLPSGWLVGRKVSDDGRGSRKYYIQPGTGIVFKSKKEAERFLKQDLGGASKERKEDTPRRELDAWEDGQIDAYEEVENLRRQLQEAVDEKNEFEKQHKEQLLLNNQVMEQMREELACEKQRRQALEEQVKHFAIVFASRRDSFKSFVEDFKSKLDHFKAQSCNSEYPESKSQPDISI